MAFHCDICGQLVKARRRLEWQWVGPSVLLYAFTYSTRKHVLGDLCTYPDCATANDLYASRLSFLDHEIMKHELFGLVCRLDFACPFCNDMLSRSKNDERARHIGRHVEEIAFSVVTKPYEDWEVYSDSSRNSNSKEDENLNVTIFVPTPRVRDCIRPSAGKLC